MKRRQLAKLSTVFSAAYVDVPDIALALKRVFEEYELSKHANDTVLLKSRLAKSALDEVCKYLGVPLRHIRSHERRGQYMSRCRRVASQVLRLLGFSLPEIGRLLARDHTSILSQLRSNKRTPELISLAVELSKRIDKGALNVQPEETEHSSVCQGSGQSNAGGNPAGGLPHPAGPGR